MGQAWLRRTIVSFFAVFLAGCATPQRPPEPRQGQPAAQDQLPIPAAYLPHVRRAEGIGRQLYLLDKVGAIGTDVVMERVPDFQSRGIGGYLPVQEGDPNGKPKDSFMVMFFTKEEPPRIAYEVRVKVNGKPDFAAFTPPKAMADSALPIVRARAAAIAAVPNHQQPLNPVVLPGSATDEKGILVYLIAGTTTPNRAVFGKHYRVLMPDHGDAPTYVMPMSKTAFELPVRKEAQGGETTEALMVTHLVSDWPLETHVLVSLQFKVPVYVGTAVGIWRIDGDKISFIDDRPPPREAKRAP